MKKIGKNIRTWCMIVLTLAVFVAGCGSSNQMSSDEMVDTESSVMYDGSAELSVDAGGASQTGDSSTAELPEGRKLIKNVNMNVETEEYDDLVTAVSKRITELSGYIENSNMGKNGNNSYDVTRYANITARVPADKVDSFVTEISEEANVISKSENIQDVTLQYVDVDSHKKALEKEQERLLELLSQAEQMEDIISIESKLTDVRYEIESYTSQLRTFDNQIDYSTVSLYITEVQSLTPVVEPSVGSQMINGLIKNVKNVCTGLKHFLIWCFISIPYFIIIVIVIILVRLILKKRKQRKLKRKAKEEAIQKAKQEEIANEGKLDEAKSNERKSNEGTV